MGRFSFSKGALGVLAGSPESISLARDLFPCFLFWNLSDFMALGRDHASRSGQGNAFSIPIPEAGPCCNGLARMFWRAIGPLLRGADRVIGLPALSQ